MTSRTYRARLVLVLAGLLALPGSTRVDAAAGPARILEALEYGASLAVDRRAFTGWIARKLLPEDGAAQGSPGVAPLKAWFDLCITGARKAGLVEESAWDLVEGKVHLGLDPPTTDEIGLPAVLLVVPLRESAVGILPILANQATLPGQAQLETVSFRDAEASTIRFRPDDPVPMVLYLEERTLYVSTSLDRIGAYLEARDTGKGDRAGPPSPAIGLAGRLRIRPVKLNLKDWIGPAPGAPARGASPSSPSPGRVVVDRWLAGQQPGSWVEMAWSADEDHVEVMIAEGAITGSPGSPDSTTAGLEVHERAGAGCDFFLGLDLATLADPNMGAGQGWGALLSQFLKARLVSELRVSDPALIDPFMGGEVGMIRWHGQGTHQGALVLESGRADSVEALSAAVVASLESEGGVVQRTEFEGREIRSAVSVDGTGDWLPSMTLDAGRLLVASDEGRIKELVGNVGSVSAEPGVAWVIRTTRSSRLAILIHLTSVGLAALVSDASRNTGIGGLSLGIGFSPAGRLRLAAYVTRPDRSP